MISEPQGPSSASYPIAQPASRAQREKVHRFKRAGAGSLEARARRWALALFATVCASCSSLNFFSLDEDRRIGAESYPQLLAEEPLAARGGQDTQRVERIFQRLIGGMEDPGFEWEVRVIDNDSVVNAWCLPGGKMAVYTGILKVAQSDDELATVMGHEMAHAIKRHGTARMSREIMTNTLIGLTFGEAKEGSEYARMGSSLLGLNYSRNDELEADKVGFFAMARAGYDPEAAPRFWRRMAELGGAGNLELLSTHPSDERRIAQLEKLMKKAKALQRELP